MQRLEGVILHIWALLFSSVVLVLGNGLQGTLLGVRAGIEGMPEKNIGFMMSAYFMGYLFGSLYSPRLIARVGHIRTFAAFASLVSAVSLAHVLVIGPISWTILRAIHGACYAGLVLVIESWLNGNTESEYRGRVLAIYGVVVMAAWTASQSLLSIADPSGFELFCLVSILLSFALVPVTLANVTTPSVIETKRTGIRQLYQISPIGVVGVFSVGFTFSAFSGLGPTFAQAIGLGREGISAFMGVTLSGALALQWPIGWLSDKIDRRWVIIVGSGLTAVVAFALVLSTNQALVGLSTLAFLFGGLSIPIYSLCIAHTNDLISERQLLPAASTLLLVFGAGSVLGPLLAGYGMNHFGPGALFAVISIIEAAFIPFGLYYVRVRPPVPEAAKEKYVYVPRTTHVILRMDERGVAEEVADEAPPE